MKINLTLLSAQYSRQILKTLWFLKYFMTWQLHYQNIQTHAVGCINTRILQRLHSYRYLKSDFTDTFHKFLYFLRIISSCSHKGPSNFIKRQLQNHWPPWLRHIRSWTWNNTVITHYNTIHTKNFIFATRCEGKWSTRSISWAPFMASW